MSSAFQDRLFEAPRYWEPRRIANNLVLATIVILRDDIFELAIQASSFPHA